MKYPLDWGSNGEITQVMNASDKLKLLFITQPGTRIGLEDYGINLTALDQMTTDMNEILPFILIQIRAAILKYVPEITLDSVFGYKRDKEFVLEVVFHDDGNQTESTFESVTEGVFNV
jgi:phage baseplate assembly protein W